METKVMDIRILADLNNPDCLNGVEKFKKALEKIDQNEIKLTYYFSPLIYCDPNIKQGIPYKEYFNLKDSKLGQDQATFFQKRIGELQEESDKLGLNLKYREVTDQYKLFSTIQAQRLMEWSLELKGDDLQGKLHNKILRANFEQGLDISDVNVLANLSEEIGIDKEQVLKFLNDKEQEPNQEQVRELAGFNIYGLQQAGGYIPSFIFSDFSTLPGSATIEEFYKNILSAASNIKHG
ncbi:Thioredoxin-like fold [Pseudocohnilembus persalinus]|uniref:Thioredoxin-like fold n=1 Tax=Pseudocohnilembus persalinus TaxID=266149 RepID=A0A0V0QI17_PSEPJ|nr:Thioredoxin-like fold [Pseudocohnilembus persalinus]|eukprot:KRX01842.1 Thioredoxin-like fold [Pseudocohnilembus persalinus]